MASTILSPNLHGSARAGEANPAAEQISTAAQAVCCPWKLALSLQGQLEGRVPGSQQGEGLQQSPWAGTWAWLCGCHCRGAIRERVPMGWRRSAQVICLLLFACITVNAVNYRHLLSGASSC